MADGFAASEEIEKVGVAATPTALHPVYPSPHQEKTDELSRAVASPGSEKRTRLFGHL